MCIEAKVSNKLVSSDNTSRRKMRESGNGASQKYVLSIVFAFLIATLLVPADSFPHGDSDHPRTVLLQRLCSKSLSNALYLICRDRGGYNEPFSYSREETQRPYSGPGLVEECCYSPCSYQQLEQYCKPLKTEEDDYSQEGMEESVRIVNLPYDSPEEMGTETRRHAVTRDEHDVERKKKSKLRGVAGVRRAGRNKGKGRKHARPSSKTANLTKKSHKAKSLRDHKDVRNADRYNNDADSPIDRAGVRTRSKNILHHHKRPKRPLRFKLQPPRDTAIAKVPGFKVGTTLPDPKDSTIHIFPSRRNLVIERTAKDLAASENTEKIQ